MTKIINFLANLRKIQSIYVTLSTIYSLKELFAEVLESNYSISTVLCFICHL